MESEGLSSGSGVKGVRSSISHLTPERVGRERPECEKDREGEVR